MSRGILRRDAFIVPPSCVVAAPLLGLSPGGLPPAPVIPGVGTFLSRGAVVGDLHRQLPSVSWRLPYARAVLIPTSLSRAKRDTARWLP
jgi:hypothetical protein